MNRYSGRSLAMILTLAGATAMAGARADDGTSGKRELDTVIPAATIDAAYVCGSFFAATKFGGGADAPLYVVFRLKGTDRNEVFSAVNTTVKIDEKAQVPKGEKTQDLWIFTLSPGQYNEAKACLSKIEITSR